MKRYLYSALILISCLLLAACSAVQVNERMFVGLMGIEEDDGLYYLTLQAYSTAHTDKDAPVPEYQVYSGTGRSFYEAADMIMRESGRQLFFGHCEAIFADGDIISDKDKLRMFAGERISVGCPVIYSEKPRSEVDRRDENDELIGADVILSALDRYAAEGLYRKATLRDITAAAERGNTVLLPFSERGIAGSAAIDMNGNVSVLGLPETAALNLLLGERGVKMSILGGSMSVGAEDVSVYFRQGEAIGEYSISVRAKGVLDETGVSRELSEYRREAENIISRSAEEICRKAFEEGFLSAVLPKEYSLSEGYENVSFSAETEIELTSENIS
ncbi:MAG: hypothetical protein MSJ26_05080 [Oscillospiraceae bacterium]|nr:hypothetical protein [Oscillospiraceae bacterium]